MAQFAHTLSQKSAAQKSFQFRRMNSFITFDEKFLLYR
jgi:hypothetical protein